MQPLTYDVAVSVDGFISSAEDDVTLFAHEGPVVEDYQKRLSTYSTAMMGRSTYELGYQFGMKPGDNPYSSMMSYVMSSTIDLPINSDVTVIPPGNEDWVRQLKAAAAGPIFLCGGGELAGWLFALDLIDRVVLKRAPILLGKGTRLFGNAKQASLLEHQHTKRYDDGYVLQDYKLSD